MLVWFAGTAWAATWWVFQSPALDYRLLMAAAVLPIVEVPWGAGPLHSLAAAVVALVVVMVATTRSRLLRRRWLAVPIGLFAHLIFDGAWINSRIFWWPFAGSVFSAPSPELSRSWWLVVVFELIGVSAVLWMWGNFELTEAGPRSKFLSTGQLSRRNEAPVVDRDAGC